MLHVGCLQLQGCAEERTQVKVVNRSDPQTRSLCTCSREHKVCTNTYLVAIGIDWLEGPDTYCLWVGCGQHKWLLAIKHGLVTFQIIYLLQAAGPVNRPDCVFAWYASCKTASHMSEAIMLTSCLGYETCLSIPESMINKALTLQRMQAQSRKASQKFHARHLWECHLQHIHDCCSTSENAPVGPIVGGELQMRCRVLSISTRFRLRNSCFLHNVVDTAMPCKPSCM